MVIDLDQPADRTPAGRRAPARWLVTGTAVVALAVGAGLGSLVTHRWTVHERQAADERQVAVLVFADQPASRNATDVITTGDGTVQVTFSDTVDLVNAGPAPIEVQSLLVDRPGLLITASAGSAPITPGTSFRVPVGVTATCVAPRRSHDTGTALAGATLPATATVRTLSNSVATVASLTLNTSPWKAQFQSANTKCLHP